MKNLIRARNIRARHLTRRLFLEPLESRIVLAGQIPEVTIDGLVSWYRAEGNANDAANGNQGSLVSGVTTAAGGKVGSAFKFAASNNRVEIPSNDGLKLQSFTLDAWVYPTFVNGGDTLGGEIIGKQLFAASNGVSVSILGPNINGRFTFAAAQASGSPSFTSTAGFGLNQWHHVAMTSDGSVIRGYVDGVLQAGSINLASDPIIYDSAVLATPWTIGGHSGLPFGFANHYFADDALIDEVGIYQRGLSAGQVAAIFNQGPLGRYTIPGGQSFSLPGAFVDADSSSWTATVDYGDGSGTQPLTLNLDQTFTISHVYATAGQRTITVAVTDDSSNTTPHSLVVNVTTPTNTPPVAVDDAFNATEDVQLTVNALGVLANDTDAQSNPLTATLVSGVSHGILNLNTDGSFTYLPAADYHGSDSFQYQASDGAFLSNTATVTITIAPENDAPVLDAIGDQSAAGGSLLTFTAGATDADAGDTLAFSLQGAPAGAAIDSETGVFSWTPIGQGPATYEFDVVVSDGSLSDSETISVTVSESVTVQLLPDPDRPGLTMLVIAGTPASDVFTATPTATVGEYTFHLNSINLGAYSPTGSVQLYGGGGSDAFVLNGNGSTNAFEVRADNLVLNGLPFYDHAGFSRTINALGSGDTITVFGGGATVNGGSASDTLAVAGAGSHSWQITAQNAGNLDGQVFFSSIEKLTGGGGADTFQLANGVGVNGEIDGGGGSDTLNYAAFTTAVSVNLQSGNATKTGGLVGVEQFNGGSAADSVTGANVATTWTLTGLGSGNNGAVSYSSFENLNGGNQADVFHIAAASVLSGNLAGGGGSDTLQYDTSSGSTVNLQSLTATGIGGVFSSIAAFIGGSGSDLLIATNTNSTWIVTSATGGTVKGTPFSGFESLRGGSAADVFKSLQGTTFAGTFDGSGGTDRVDYAVFTSAVDVNLLAGTATGLTGVSGVEDIAGGDGDDFLMGNAANNVIVGGAGEDIILGWSGSDTLSGGGGRDFVIGGTGADVIHGNATEDMLVAATIAYGNETTSVLDRTAVDALMAEWRRTDISYAARIAHLTGTTGGGLNGAYVLNASTVFDDPETDHLFGDAGQDWFLAGDKDSISAAGNEIVTFFD